MGLLSCWFKQCKWCQGSVGTKLVGSQWVSGEMITLNHFSLPFLIRKNFPLHHTSTYNKSNKNLETLSLHDNVRQERHSCVLCISDETLPMTGMLGKRQQGILSNTSVCVQYQGSPEIIGDLYSRPTKVYWLWPWPLQKLVPQLSPEQQICPILTSLFPANPESSLTWCVRSDGTSPLHLHLHQPSPRPPFCPFSLQALRPTGEPSAPYRGFRQPSPLTGHLHSSDVSWENLYASTFPSGQEWLKPSPAQTPSELSL